MTSSDVGADGDAVALVALRGIVKRFGTLTANDRIDLDVRAGEIHALLGENGAGKSTLVKILYGLLQPNEGEILWQGRAVDLPRPDAATALGIGMVFQHFSLFENLTVAENVAAALPPGEDLRNLNDRIAAVGRRYGLALDPSRPVWTLSAGERQRIEIVRALSARAAPAHPRRADLGADAAGGGDAVLDAGDAGGRRLRPPLHHPPARGGAPPVPSRHGAAGGAGGGDLRPAARERDGPRRDDGGFGGGGGAPGCRPRSRARPFRASPPIARLARPPRRLARRRIAGRSRGEIVGIAGVAGNGQSELFEAMSGENLAGRADAVLIDGEPAGLTGIDGRRRRGAGFVPEERNGHAAAPRLTLSENVVLSRHADGMARGGLVDLAAAREAAQAVIRAFDVRKGKADPPAGTLSGGNLQKFVVGREMLRRPGVLVVNQPTWGVDPGATATIRQALIDLAASGAAVVVISQDLDEIFAIADRIAVIHDGRLSPALPARTVSREDIGLLMAGSGGGAAHAA